MSLIYLASPYAHEDPSIREQRYEDVLEVTGYFVFAGFHVYSPIVHNHNIGKKFATKKEHGDFDFWERYDFSILRKCDAFWILTIDGWKESKGIRKEFDLAKRLYLDISLIDIHKNIKPFFESDYATKT